MNENAKKFKEWHGKIYQNYLDAATHLEIWWLLHNEKYIKFINRNKEFFKFTELAHLSVGVLAITRIFDRHRQSINIRGFLDFCSKNKKDIETAFPGCKFCDKNKQQIEKEIDGLESDLKLITEWRNKLIAHEEISFQGTPIKWSHFSKTINFLEKNILDYGSKPNQIFPKAEDLFLRQIEAFFDKHFQK